MHIVRMNTVDEVAALRKRIRDNGLKVSDVLREACVDASTWTRWQSGQTVPRLDNWRAIERAIDRLTPTPKKGRAMAS